MRIRFSPPFDQWTGREIHFETDGPLPLRVLIDRLAERLAGLREYAEKRTDIDLNAHITFIREGRPVKLEELVDNDDTLDVLLPASGG